MTQLASGGPAAAILEQMVRGPDGRLRAIDFFIYSQTFLGVLTGGTASLDISIQADSDFLAYAGVATMRDSVTNVADADREATVTLLDSGSGRQVFDRVQDFDNVFGTAQRPAWWPTPKILNRSSTLTVTISNLDANTRDFRIALWGVKVFSTTMGLPGGR